MTETSTSAVEKKYALYNEETKQYSGGDNDEVRWVSDLETAREMAKMLGYIVVDAEELVKGNIVKI